MITATNGMSQGTKCRSTSPTPSAIHVYSHFPRAQRFDVPVDFLLQQVAYLTERHASQVRAQVRKATAAAKGGSGAPSPTPGIDSSASALRGVRRESLAVPGEGSGANTPVDAWARPMPARSASTNTAVLGDAGTSSPRPTKGVQAWAAEQIGRRRMSSLPIIGTIHNRRPTVHDENMVLRETSPEPAETESAMSSDDESSPAQSRIIRRPPRFSQQQELSTYDEDEGEESEPAFQPYRPSRDENQNSTGDLTSTLRGGLNQGGSRRGGTRAGKEPDRHSQTSDSDTSSPAIVQRPGGHREQRNNPGVLSPRRTADLAGRGSSSKTNEGSDGTPSMGSSYSDLDGEFWQRYTAYRARSAGLMYTQTHLSRSQHWRRPWPVIWAVEGRVAALVSATRFAVGTRPEGISEACLFCPPSSRCLHDLGGWCLFGLVWEHCVHWDRICLGISRGVCNTWYALFSYLLYNRRIFEKAGSNAVAHQVDR